MSEPSKDPQEQLDWEAKQRPRAAIAAALGGLLVFGGQIGRQRRAAGRARAPASSRRSRASPRRARSAGRESLQIATAQFLSDHALGADRCRAIVEALGYFAVAYALTFLAAATRARRPELVEARALPPGRRRRADGASST